MPSHSWPVVSTPASSLFLLAIAFARLVVIRVRFQRKLGGVLEALLVARPEGVEQHASKEDDEEDKRSDLSNGRHLLVGHGSCLTSDWGLRHRSWQNRRACRASADRRREHRARTRSSGHCRTVWFAPWGSARGTPWRPPPPA